VIWVREALLEEVLAAPPQDPLSLRVTRTWAPYSAWKLAGVGYIGAVGVQLPDETMGTIATLFPRRMAEWVVPNVRNEGNNHWYWLAVLQRGEPLPHRPIVRDGQQQIHDGKHRLFAVYDHLRAEPTFELEVFWNRSSSPTP
jgi:hypothetical protein